MNREALASQFRRIGCTPHCEKDEYSSLLVRCGCGDHALAAAVCGDEPGETVKLFGAALSWYQTSRRSGPLTFVLLADRSKDPEGRYSQQALEALQSLQPESVEVQLLIDFERAPVVSTGDLHEAAWLERMVARDSLELCEAGLRLEEAARRLGFRWYRSVTGSEWSGRLDGLEICVLNPSSRQFVFSVGRAGQKESASHVEPKEKGARKAFLAILRNNAAMFGLPASATSLLLSWDDQDRARAETFIRLLAEQGLREHCSAEHRLEARVLRGEVTLIAAGQPLLPVAEKYPFQFPARWWRGGRARFIDVMAHQGSTPWVVELKVDGGQGEYYRNGIVQTALYLEYVRRSPGLDPWFEKKGLKRSDCRAAIVVAPLHGPDANSLRENHRGVAAELGVEFIEEDAAAQ